VLLREETEMESTPASWIVSDETSIFWEALAYSSLRYPIDGDLAESHQLYQIISAV
jgi:hypothetical protein